MRTVKKGGVAQIAEVRREGTHPEAGIFPHRIKKGSVAQIAEVHREGTHPEAGIVPHRRTMNSLT